MNPVVLVFNRFYLPGFRAGGPIRTLANLVDRLGDAFDFRIVALDRDSGDDGPYEGVDLAGWNVIGKARVRYISKDRVSLKEIREIVQDVSPDTVYLNSLFDPIFTQRVLWLRRMGPLLDVPVVLAPRGEFSTGALSLKSGRKRAFLRFAAVTGLYRGLTWQVSSEREKQDMLRTLGSPLKGEIKVAMNLAPTQSAVGLAARSRDPKEPLRICFLSRIAPMKNLDFALRCLRQCEADVVFTIYGPKSHQEYWAECEAIIVSLPANISVVYGGEVEHEQVREVLAEHDLFFFPTRGENYGHVIREAMSAGLPVLISDQTPWKSLEERGVGWVHSLTSPSRFTATIHEVASLSASDHDVMRQRALAYAFEQSNDAEAIRANKELFYRSNTMVP